MSVGTAIAAEIEAGLIEAATATGQGRLVGQLLRGGTVDRAAYPVVAVGGAEFDVTLVLTGYSAQDRAGGGVREGDVKALVAATGEAPRTGDRLRVGGTVYSLVAVETVQPGGVPLLYRAQARG